MKHPIQPLEIDEHGVQRFKSNAIVQYLLDNGGIDMNDLAKKEFSADDRQQFAQLIGYSLSGYADLSYVDDEAYAAAQSARTDDAREKILRENLDGLREALRAPMAALFEIHPDDLGRTR